MVNPKTDQTKLLSLARSPFNWIDIRLSNLYRKFVWFTFVIVFVAFTFSIALTCYVTGQPRKKVTARFYVYKLTPAEASNVTSYISQQRANLLP